MRIMFALPVLIMFAGCSTSKEQLLPSGENTMLELWNNQQQNGKVMSLNPLRRSLNTLEQQHNQDAKIGYSRSQYNEISQQFPRLPNPDMVMYVYPHLVQGNTPVPGYSTVFSFYKQTHYALPGERTGEL
ncbi:TIGR03751 family conjugal transfer lipoprotein [Rouxiella silvae]|jgi:conjugative transfer region lipoprotein (TIGR03751 family)|nr:TIGR03751 family conjugal transfer lipoprotein [Rouxiella silvae]